MKTNIKINYLIFEQVLRITGTYKNICDEYEFLDVIFKQAKTGEIDTLFRVKETREEKEAKETKEEKETREAKKAKEAEEAKNTALEIIQHISGIHKKYWEGKERIKLGIRCKNKEINYDSESIDTVNIDNDERYISEEGIGHAYYGILYQEQLKNPLHLDYDELYDKVSKKESSENEIEEAVKVIEELYSLRGLLTIILLNMSEAGEIGLIDKANVYRHKSWTPYINMKKFNKLTKQGIQYSPKYIEIRKGLVQTIIRNIFSIGYVFTFRDLDKDFTI